MLGVLLVDNGASPDKSSLLEDVSPWSGVKREESIDVKEKKNTSLNGQ